MSKKKKLVKCSNCGKEFKPKEINNHDCPAVDIIDGQSQECEK